MIEILDPVPAPRDKLIGGENALGSKQKNKVVWGFIDERKIAIKFIMVAFPPVILAATFIIISVSKITGTNFYLILTPIYLLAIVALLFASRLKFAAYNDRIQIKYGLLGVHNFILNRENILAIRQLPFTASYYFGIGGINVFPENEGWIGIIASFDGEALAIVTSKQKYIVSCPDAENAEKILNDIYVLDRSVAVEPPIRQ